MFFKFLFLVFVTLISIFPASAQPRNDTQARCQALGYEFSAAINARDFIAYKSLASWGINNCKPYLQAGDYIYLYGNLALAESEFGNYSAALKATNYCISQKYNVPDCHVEKARALQGLNRIAEYEKQKKIALSVLAGEKTFLEKEVMQSNVSPSRRNLIKSEIYKYDSMIDFLNSQ
jgi:hypothetical protein